ncbi:MAG: hypothetical protein ACYSUK_02355 [Planctomycetota bacterium]|jgi:hypothetical protein
MLKNALITTLVLSCFCIVGCKKKSTPAETTEDVAVKSAAEYEMEAEKEITAENMDAELNALEKEMEAELQ